MESSAASFAGPAAAGMGPNHFTLKDGGAVCSLCEAKNPLGNLRKMALQEVNTASTIIVCFTQSGTGAHALHTDCKTVLGRGSSSHPRMCSIELWCISARLTSRSGSTVIRRCGQGAVK